MTIRFLTKDIESIRLTVAPDEVRVKFPLDTSPLTCQEVQRVVGLFVDWLLAHPQEKTLRGKVFTDTYIHCDLFTNAEMGKNPTLTLIWKGTALEIKEKK